MMVRNATHRARVGGAKGWVQRRQLQEPAKTLTCWRRVSPSNQRVGAFYAAPHAWASGAPRPALAVDHTRDRCPAGRTDPRHTPSEARARPAAALPVGVPLLPRVRVRPGEVVHRAVRAS